MLRFRLILIIILRTCISIVSFVIEIFTRNTVLGYDPNETKTEQKPLEKKDDEESNEKEALLVSDHYRKIQNLRSHAKHLEFLEAYRGLSALFVVNKHAFSFMWFDEKNLFMLSVDASAAVQVFFVLSAFLLTYRFIKELDESFKYYYCNLVKIGWNSKADRKRHFIAEAKIFCLITVKYAIRRFMRIYVSFAIYAHDFQIITFQNLRFPHLWMIPLEIEYYCYIPLVGLFFVKFKRHALVLVVSTFILVLLNEKFLFLSGEKDEMASFFPTFLSGSLVAVVYCFYFEQLKMHGGVQKDDDELPLSRLIRGIYSILKPDGRWTNRIMNILFTCILIETHIILIQHYGSYWFGHEIHTDSLMIWCGMKPTRLILHIRPGIIIACYVLVMIVTEPISLTNYLANSQLLRTIGKYSYGFYLLHWNVLAYRYVLGAHSTTELVFLVNIFSLVAGFLFYYLVENPLMNLASKLCKLVDKVCRLEL